MFLATPQGIISVIVGATALIVVWIVIGSALRNEGRIQSKNPDEH